MNYAECDFDENPDDARLISAAPDLLEALEDILECGLSPETAPKARAAIKKARGEL